MFQHTVPRQGIQQHTVQASLSAVMWAINCGEVQFVYVKREERGMAPNLLVNVRISIVTDVLL